jgi:hypothetical protein
MATENVICTANRGQTYRVVFHSGEPFAVFCRHSRYGSDKTIERKVWQAGAAKFSLTAHCAINSAKAKLARDAAQARIAGLVVRSSTAP